MCGISGLWFQNEIKEEFLTKYGSLMSSELSKRGPDSEGIWFENSSSILFTHRRLAIRDLSPTGYQPMKSADKNLIIIFNGEIYNFKELKKQLKNQNWHGSSDTEILLAAIQEWGLEVALEKSLGMFSLALWNIKNKTLIIARDRFGEKPLYWGKVRLKGLDNSAIAFTSDLSALWAIPEVEKEIEYNAFSDFLKYGYVNCPDSIHKGIFQLMPGSYVEISSNKGFAPNELPNPIKWWDINKVSSQCYSQQREQDDSDFLEETLKKVLDEQKLADVPTAAFLSGGIDSSLIASLLQHQSKNKIKTFNIAFPDQGFNEGSFNEGPFARKIAEFLKTDHTEINLTSKEVQSIIPILPDIYSEPFSDVSQLATYLICKEIRSKGIKVALCGDGADELFGGYSRHSLAPFINKNFKKFPKKFRFIISNLVENMPSKDEGINHEKRRKLIDSINNASGIDSIYDAIVSNNIDIKKFHRNRLKAKSKSDNITEIKAPSESEIIMLADTMKYLPNNTLVKLDRASMHIGLETRSPFLDERIAKIAWGSELNSKINYKFKGKAILKKILYKYIPKEYFKRPKTGFSLPIASWLRGPLKEWANDLMNKNLIKRQGYLSYENVNKVWFNHLNGKSDNTELIWTILMWQSWITKWEKLQ